MFSLWISGVVDLSAVHLKDDKSYTMCVGWKNTITIVPNAQRRRDDAFLVICLRQITENWNCPPPYMRRGKEIVSSQICCLNLLLRSWMPKERCLCLIVTLTAAVITAGPIVLRWKDDSSAVTETVETADCSGKQRRSSPEDLINHMTFDVHPWPSMGPFHTWSGGEGAI